MERKAEKTPLENANSFLYKLWWLVNDGSIPQIHWSLDGEKVIIENPTKFTAKVLTCSDKQLFKTKNISSFIRQLNLYGFRRVKHNCGKIPLIFQNELFKRERPDLLGLYEFFEYFASLEHYSNDIFLLYFSFFSYFSTCSGGKKEETSTDEITPPNTPFSPPNTPLHQRWQNQLSHHQNHSPFHLHLLHSPTSQVHNPTRILTMPPRWPGRMCPCLLSHLLPSTMVQPSSTWDPTRQSSANLV